MDFANFTSAQMNTLRKAFRAVSYFVVFMWRLGFGRIINIWPQGTGRILVIKHRGRKTGRERLTPVNHALVEGEIYCTAGFGAASDWYRNMLANLNVELWLPEGRRPARARDVSDSPNRIFLLKQVIIAAGFAGLLFGVDQKKLSDERLNRVSKDYRLVHFE
jgi:deazaflavin-dependent oxidoreductase (nitroreductase family)